MNEIPTLENWIYTVLAADSATAAAVGTRIYSGHSPKKTETPFITYFQQGGNDVQGFGVNRTKATLIYAVQVVEKDRLTDAAQAAATRIDELLGKAVRIVHQGLEISGRRRSTFRRTDNEGGTRYEHLGGVYAFEVYQMP